MNFVIVRSEGMSIDNAMLTHSFDSWLQPNEQIVAWRGTVGSGTVEYSSGPRVLRRIDNLAPYESAIDAWMTVAAGLPQPLNLEQARRIKMDLVDAFFNNLRNQPYWHWEDGIWYETTDEAVTHMAAAVASIGLVRRFDEAISYYSSLGLIYRVNRNVDLNNWPNSSLAVNTWSVSNHINWDDLYMNHVPAASGVGTTSGWAAGGTPPDAAWASHAHTAQFTYGTSGSDSLMGHWIYLGSGGFLPMNYLDPIYITSGGTSPVPWSPLTGAITNINADRFRNALHAIIDRRNELNRIRVERKNHIQNVLGSVAAVIAFPAWP